ncbi:MAG: NAD(P)-binding domain-containing protein, partial [Acidimicrobiia bacterium]|nr:NAD(P)-binding domain-containing protein [Acidimicrobiia bacterium]
GAGKAAPLVRVKPKDLAAVAERVGRVAGVRDGRPVLDDGRRLDVANVIWCTGFERGFPWIDLDVFDENGRPRHERGVVTDQPGLYFCGLDFLHSLWSETVIGEVTDARYVVKNLSANRPPVRRATV